MRKIKYEGKYLTKEIVESCYQENSLTFVDKTFCGNGFTHWAMRIEPSEGKFHLLIVPNIEVAKSKRDSYNNPYIRAGFFGDFDTKDRVKDIFRNKFDLVIMVSDTFVQNSGYFKEHKSKIDRITIDEMHSVYIQSDFRYNLVKFIDTINKDFKDVTGVQVTATPMLSQLPQVNIRLSKDISEYKDINVSYNVIDSIKSCVDAIEDGRNVLVATQDRYIIKKIVGDRDVNYKIGSTLMGKLAEIQEIKHKVGSNLTIISSRGFEGFDLDNGINDVFIFENRSSNWSSFYFQNIIQIIGRSRNGVGYVRYCSVPMQSIPKKKNKDVLINRAENGSQSISKLFSGSDGSTYKRFFEPIHTDGLIEGLKFKGVSYDMYEERYDHNINQLEIYDDYAKQRGFRVVKLNDVYRTITRQEKGYSNKSKLNNLIKNKAYLESNGIFDDIKPNALPQLNRKAYIKEVTNYIRRKHYSMPDDTMLNIPALDFIMDESRVNRLIKDLSKDYRKKKLKEYNGNRRSKFYLKDVADFEGSISEVVYRLSLTFLSDVPYFPSNHTIFRDYNLSTRTSMMVLERMGDMFGYNVLEYDISRCNIRIIYAKLGIDLPKNIYGKNKSLKREINSVLNQISKYHAIEKGLDTSEYKRRTKSKMKSLNIDERAIEWLYSEFWDRHKGALFNWCAYHESKIIAKTKDALECNFGTYFNWIRRHDSLITFAKKGVSTHKDATLDIIKDVEHLGVTNWYGYEVVEMVSEDVEIESIQLDFYAKMVAI